MLTDIFADRYLNRVIWNQLTAAEAKLLTQCFALVSEDVIPYYVNGKESERAKGQWQSIHDRLSRELGVSELSKRWYSYQTVHMGKPHTMTGQWSIHQVCKTFFIAERAPTVLTDRYMKERLSFVELAFRLREEELTEDNPDKSSALAATELIRKWSGSGPRIPGDPGIAARARHQTKVRQFKESVDELNERLRRAGAPLNYHNGFIQISRDELVEAQVAKPFWSAVSAPEWKNVDTDMKEALDRRDANDRDPAFYAAKALESTIKIVSDKKGWTHGGEKGAHSYIDNLGSVKNGHFIDPWERDALKTFFTAVRNPLGHGPGDKEMPELSPQQTDWAIETCMSWVKTLISRL